MSQTIRSGLGTDIRHLQRLSGNQALGALLRPPDTSRHVAAEDASPAVRSGALGHGEPMEPVTRRFMEARFGTDFTDVRIHAGAQAAEAAQSVAAKAYTVGPEIVFGPGYYAPGTHEGRRLLAHELAHVMQQTRSPARAQASAHRAESEASAAGASAASGHQAAVHSAVGPGIQRDELPASSRKPPRKTDAPSPAPAKPGSGKKEDPCGFVQWDIERMREAVGPILPPLTPSAGKEQTPWDVKVDTGLAPGLSYQPSIFPPAAPGPRREAPTSSPPPPLPAPATITPATTYPDVYTATKAKESLAALNPPSRPPSADPGATVPEAALKSVVAQEAGRGNIRRTPVLDLVRPGLAFFTPFAGIGAATALATNPSLSDPNRAKIFSTASGLFTGVTSGGISEKVLPPGFGFKWGVTVNPSTPATPATPQAPARPAVPGEKRVDLGFTGTF